MGRTASPVTPGDSPKVDAFQADSAADLSEAVVQEGVRAEVAESEVERLKRELSELKGLVHTLGRNQLAQAAPEKVELPEIEDVQKNSPEIPMLTKQGWYVPLVHPTSRLKA